MVAVSRRRPVAALAAALLATALLLLPSSARADEISDKKAKAAEIATKIDQLSHEVERYAEAANGAQYALDQLNGQIAEAQGRVDAAQAEVDLRRQQLKGYAVDAYVHGDRASLIEQALSDSNANPDDFGQRTGYLNAAADSRQQLIDELRATQENLNDQIVQFNTAKAEAETRTNDLRAAQQQAQAAVAQQQQLKAQNDAELASLIAQAQAAAAAAEAQRAQQRAQQEQQRQAARPPSGGGGGGTSPAPAPGPAPSPRSGASGAVDVAMQQIGVPYVWGGASPSGFDCSGLTMYAWKNGGGVSLPHFTDAQYAGTTHISLSQLQPGDLVFYNGSGGSWEHVAMYIGNGQIVHAPGAGRSVRVDALYYWDTNMAASRP